MTMMEFTASWRFTVIVLAIACAGNAMLVFVPDITPSPVVRASSILSAACAAALIASLKFTIRKITLLLACFAMLMSTYETVVSDVTLWNKVRLISFFTAFGLISFGAWLHAMKGCWPTLTRAWRVALI